MVISSLISFKSIYNFITIAYLSFFVNIYYYILSKFSISKILTFFSILINNLRIKNNL